jgi:ABC-type multidrug transport system fused ATPase/permease subunit
MANQALPRLLGLRLDTSSSSSSSQGGGTDAGNIRSNYNNTPWIVLGGGLASLLRTVLLARAEGSIVAQLRIDAVSALLLRKDLQWFQQTSNSNVGTTTTTTNDNANNDSGLSTTSTNNKDNKTNTSTTASTTGTTTDPVRVNTPAAVLHVLTADVPEMAACMTTVGANALRSTSAVVYSIYHMCCLDAQLVGYAIAVLPTVGAVAMALRKAVQKASRQADISAQQATNFLQERLQHVTVVHAAHRQASEVHTYSQLTEDNTKAITKQAWLQGSFMGFTFIASNAALLLVTHRGGQAVARGRLTAGQLTTFTTYAFLLALGTAGLVSATAKWSKGLRAAERYYELLVEEGDDEDSEDGTTLPPETSTVPTESVTHNNPSTEEVSSPSPSSTEIVSQINSWEVQNLCFAYRSSTQPVLRNISFTLQRGQVVALVGRNGSGKSTLAHLLAGLYPPTSGRIALSNGTELGDLSAAVRKHLVQLVPQTTALFDLSLRDNVRYAAPDATDEQITLALQQANGQAMVDSKAGGWDYSVGPQGSQLSGGERQRLCLARALVANPAVLILDEPTASLDAEGEAAVADALTACRQQQRTLVLITHQVKRLSEVDYIVVLQEGEIVERGTYTELVRNKKSVLRQLYPDLS